MNLPASLHERLRTETADLHDRLEALPYFQALHAGRLSKLTIVSFLRGLGIIHAVLERQLSQVENQAIAKLARHATPKVSLLMADLEAIGANSLPAVMPAIQLCLNYAAELLVQAEDQWSLVGVLYVLEGSQQGGIVLKHAYVRCLHPREQPLSYFGCYGRDTAAHWRTFRTMLNALGAGAEQSEQVERSAIRCFERLIEFCAALYPHADSDVAYHVAAVNFEAGNHSMPQDPLEIDLALRAGKIAWQNYSYLERRFGDRGRRFTSSDSCWLVTLTRMPVETATRSLMWLRTVLASRGIPTVILEAHLLSIMQALAAEFPERIEMRTRVDRFLANLDAERAARGNGEILSRLVEQFDQRFRSCGGPAVAAAAELIASAWIDERAGIAGALAAVRDWFADPARFSSDWIAVVRALVTELDRTGGAAC